MEDTKHTLGPWRIGDAGHTVFGPPNGAPSPLMVAQRVRRADARLIAAAPELLAALEETLRALEAHLDETSARTNISRAGICPCETNEVVRARAAIDRATGGK
jgi:hypothetical protein